MALYDSLAEARRIDPVPDGGLTTGSDDSGSPDGWDYPGAVDTQLEKKAWRDAGGDYAEAQRLINARKNSGGGSGEPADDDNEGGLTTGGDGSQDRLRGGNSSDDELLEHVGDQNPRTSTAGLEHQRDNINRHAASDNYDPPGSDAAKVGGSSGPSTGKSMPAIALTSMLTGSDAAKVGDWVKKHGWNKGTTLHISEYNLSGDEMIIYGPNKQKSVTVGGGTNFAAGVTSGAKGFWQGEMLNYYESLDSGPGGRSKLEYVNDALANSEWKFIRMNGKIATTSTTISKDDRESHGESVTGDDAKQPGESARVTEDDLIGPEDADTGDPVPDGGLTTGSDDSGSPDGWDYPGAVDTPMEKKAWRDAGGDYAKAQRLINARKNSGGGSGETADDDNEGGLTTGGDGSQGDDSDSSDSGDSDRSGSGGSSGTDTKTAAAAGVLALAAAKYGGMI